MSVMFEEGFLITQSDSSEHEMLLSIFYVGLYWLYGDMREYRLKGEDALSQEGKRYIARIILFLQSDCDYRWPTQKMELSFQLSPVFAVLGFSLLGAMYFNKESLVDFFGLFYLIGYVVAAILFLFAWVYKGKSYGNKCSCFLNVDDVYADESIWPFYSQAEYAYALAHPKLLSGVKSFVC